MSINFGWVLIVVGLLGLLPSLRLLVAWRRPSRTQWLRGLASALVLLLGLLEIQQRHDAHPLLPSPEISASFVPPFAG